MTVVASFPKNDREEIRVTRETFRGQPYIGVRVWYLDERQAFQPGRQGLSIKASLLPQLIEAMQRASEGGAP